MVKISKYSNVCNRQKGFDDHLESVGRGVLPAAGSLEASNKNWMAGHAGTFAGFGGLEDFGRMEEDVRACVCWNLSSKTGVGDEKQHPSERHSQPPLGTA